MAYYGILFHLTENDIIGIGFADDTMYIHHDSDGYTMYILCGYTW
jgi:hypothetical protein